MDRVGTVAARAGDRPQGGLIPTVDVTGFLSGWLVLLYGLSAGLVVPGFGAIGQPAALVALVAPMWWATGRLVPSLGLDRSLQPVRVALFVYAGYMLVSYAMGSTRMLTELERSNSTRALIILVAVVGVAALAADGIQSVPRLETLLRRLTTLGALFAAFGLLQWVTGESFHFTPPGLEWNVGGGEIGTRGGISRPRSTGLHPIEYAVMTASLVPLAVHFALYGRDRAERRRAVGKAVLLLLAVPISLSRSAVVCLAAALIVLAFGWTWRRRANAVVLGLLALPFAAGLIPEVVDVMIDLFTASSSDASVQARIDRVPDIMALVRERPWFGMGYGTYNPIDYFLIDNEVWVTTIATGMLGLLITLGLAASAGITAVWTRYRPRATPALSHLGRAIAASIAGMTVSLATFDAFYYRILMFTLFLLMGCAGALWRLTGPPVGDDLRLRQQERIVR